MSLADIIELLNKAKVSKDFPVDIKLLKQGFIESIKEIESGKVPEETITEVARIVNELLSS